MAAEKFKRKLTAILSADVKGYSRLMGEDEEGTLRLLNSYKGLITGFLQRCQGRVVGSAGDSILAEFSSVVDAVQCAVEVQKELKTRNADLPENRRMEFRIGINLGEVVEDGDTIYGDGVNIAARLQTLAEAGGICISGTVYENIKNKMALGFEYVGEQVVKNIAEPVRIYRVLMEPKGSALSKGIGGRAGGKKVKGLVISLAVVGIVLAGIYIWKFIPQPTSSKMEVASKEKMALPLPEQPSIAVLPFVNMSDDAKQDYFSDGMTEDLITDLSKISGLLVIARNSTFTYKGKSVKVKQVAEELGVRYVLEGSVRRAGDQIRINAQLIDAMTGHHLWADRYDGMIGNIFSLQDQITQKIVSALALKLAKTDRGPTVTKGTDNVAAYDELLKGWDSYLRGTPEDFKKAVISFKKAIELDPNYSRAYAALSLSYWNVGAFSPFIRTIGISFPEARLRSREYLVKAMKQPSSIAHNVTSQMYLQRRQHKEAISELERAIALDPNDPLSNGAMGHALIMAGRAKEAIDYIQKGMRLDPHNPSQYLYFLGMAHFCMGEFAKGSDLVEKAIKLSPEITSYYGPGAAVYSLTGRDREAKAAIETLRQKFGELSPLELHMYHYPFKERPITERYAESILKAGYPRGTISSGYFPAFKENQLTGEEIRNLLLGSTITGIDFGLGEWWIDYKKTGEFTWRSPPDTDKGKTRIEGDMLCTQYSRNWWGLEDCMTVFKNSKGSREKKDEYFFTRDIGFQPFSLAR